MLKIAGGTGLVIFGLHGQTESDRQAGPVSLIQVRHIQFGRLPSQTSVVSFFVSQQPLHYAKSMLHFGPDRGFSTLNLSGGILLAAAQLSQLRRAAVDSIFDFPALARIPLSKKAHRKARGNFAAFLFFAIAVGNQSADSLIPAIFSASSFCPGCYPGERS